MSEEVFSHKYTEDNGDIVEIRIVKVPVSNKNQEGISYSCVYVREGKRLIGYDNFEGHQGELRHHKHTNEMITPYNFIDIWKLLDDFNHDIENLKQREGR